MDMVCEKNKEFRHDFSNDPLKLKIINIDEKKWLTAEGTTLGADNATGMAYSLALMNKIYNGDLNFEHLEINLLFTVGEEAGMFGAMQIDKDLLRGKTIINLDSAREDLITIGCVGTLITFIEIKINSMKLNQIKDSFQPLKINVTGLLGGHSGGDIDKGRANSIKLIAKIIEKLNKKFIIHVKSIEGGGTNRNAIPREANAIIYVKEDELPKIQEFFNILVSEIKKDYSKVEKTLNISLLEMRNHSEDLAFSKEFQDKFLDVLNSFPNGVISMHPKFDDLVHTSTNLASITTKKTRIKIDTMQRSFENLSYKNVSENIIKLFKDAGLNIRFRQMGGFGEWNPDLKSPILKLTKETFEELYDGEIIITAVHGGLEPGVFRLNYPDLNMITIGPTLEALHSPDERLDIQSVEKFWKIFIALLKKL
jgi:dipeptidase D